MPLLEIVASKKVNALITLEESTAKQVDQYAAMTAGSADDVLEAAIAYVFSKDKDFQKFREQNPTAKPVLPLRVRRPATNGMKAAASSEGTLKHSTSARGTASHSG